MTKNDIEPQSVTVAGERSRTEPYELPAGWKWVRGDELFEPMESIQPIGETFDYIDIDAIDNANQIVTSPKVVATENAPSRASRKLHSGDTVFSMVRPYLKNIAYIDESLSNAIASTGFFVCTPKNFADKRYVYNLMKSPYVVDGLNAFMKGDNSPSIRKTDIENYPFPLPPTLAEQQRIVSRIESLFTKLDEAKDKAQSVVDGFELRRAAVLHKAFTGQLKIDNEELTIEDWEEKKLEDVLIEKPRNGYSTTAVDYETPYKTMSLSATTSGYFRPEFYKYIEADISDDSFLWLKPGDILIQRANSLDKVGTSAIYTGGEHEFIYPDLMMKLQVKESVSTKFIAYQLKTEKSMSYFRNNATGTAGNMPKINQKTVCNLPIKLPPLYYQLSIVNFLDTVLEKESRAKEAAGAVLDQIALLKKSILARAFRGEL